MNGSILVFGMPRTGTTWVGKLFDSHPETLYRHEPDSVVRLSMPLFPEQQDAERYRSELKHFLASMPYLRSPKIVGKQPLFPKRYLSVGGLLAYRMSVAAAKAVGPLTRRFPTLYRPTARRYDRARLVWKSIESPGRLGVCIDVLPEVCAIHLMRHPCGYVASVLRGEAERRFGDLIPSGEDLWYLKLLLATSTAKIHGLTEEDIQRLKPEERLAWRWVLTHEKILADIEHSHRVLTLRYEDICTEPNRVTRKMFDFAGLTWHAQSERFVNTSSQTTDTDYYSIFKHSRTSADRWRWELTSEVVARILGIVRRSRLYRYYDDSAEQQPIWSEART